MFNLFQPMLVIRVTKKGVETKTRGRLSDVNTFTAKAYEHLSARAEYSDRTNKRILNGQWNKHMEDESGGLTD